MNDTDGTVALEHPEDTAIALRRASASLSAAYGWATYSDGEDTGMNGPVRDMIFGLNTAVESLAGLVEEAADAAQQATFYRLFIAEMDALTINVADPVAHVVGVLTRAAKRAQMVHDGELLPISDRLQTPRGVS